MQYLQCDLSSYSIIYEVEINKDNCHIEILFQFDCFHDFCDLITRFCFTLIIYVKYIKLCNKVSFTKGSEHFNILLPPPSPPPGKWRTGIGILPVKSWPYLYVWLYFTGLALISIKSFFEDNRSLPPNEKLSIWNVTTSIYRYKFYIGQEFLINSEYELKLLLLSSINSKGLTIVHICYNFKMHYTDQQNLL